MEVDITLKNYRCFPDEKPATIRLRPGLTAFVGANNSGKSSFLRFFFESRPLFQLVLNTNDRTARRILVGQGAGFGLAGTRDQTEVFCNNNVRNLEIKLGLKDPKPATNWQEIVFTKNRSDMLWSAEFYRGGNALPLKGRPVVWEPKAIRFDSEKLKLEPLLEIADDLTHSIYIASFRNVINVGGTAGYYDIAVGEAFVQRWRTFKSGISIKQNEAANTVTQDIKKVFRFKQLEINPSDDGQTLQMLIDGKSYFLAEVGSGLAQFIIVLINVVIRKPTYILIDEPELNLHPSLQLDFLTALAVYAKKGVIFATHSVGLARSAADQIYSFKRIDQGKSEVRAIEDTPRMAEFLGELSFSSYRELGFEQILLVEGSTDIKTVQQFLRKYKKDHEIVLLPLGGSGMINKDREAELVEVRRIVDNSENIAALIDSERNSDGEKLSSDRQGFVDICKRLNIKCHVLKLRAIENYLSENVIKRIKGDKYGALRPYDKLKDSSYGWAKSENWRIAREMTREDLDETDLGVFLKSL